MKIKLDDNFMVEVDKNAFDNMELIDALALMDEGNPLAMSKVCDLVFTKDTKIRIYDHCRKDGRVPVADVSNLISEVFTKLGQEEKN